jgi:hypothetical protein
MQCRSQSPSGHLKEREISCPCLEWNHDFSVSYPLVHAVYRVRCTGCQLAGMEGIQCLLTWKCFAWLFLCRATCSSVFVTCHNIRRYEINFIEQKSAGFWNYCAASSLVKAGRPRLQTTQHASRSAFVAEVSASLISIVFLDIAEDWTKKVNDSKQQKRKRLFRWAAKGGGIHYLSFD